MDQISGFTRKFLQSWWSQEQHHNFRSVNQLGGGALSIGDATTEAAMAIETHTSPTKWMRLNAIGAAELGLNAHALTARC